MKFATVINILKPFFLLALPTVHSVPADPGSFDLEARQNDPDTPCTDDDVGGPPKERALGNETSFDTNIQKRALDGVRLVLFLKPKLYQD